MKINPEVMVSFLNHNGIAADKRKLSQCMRYLRYFHWSFYCVGTYTVILAAFIIFSYTLPLTDEYLFARRALLSGLIVNLVMFPSITFVWFLINWIYAKDEIMGTAQKIRRIAKEFGRIFGKNTLEKDPQGVHDCVTKTLLEATKKNLLKEGWRPKLTLGDKLRIESAVTNMLAIKSSVGKKFDPKLEPDGHTIFEMAVAQLTATAKPRL
ncbi:MAG: hypothetical protein WC269_06415 [Candidatus Gracilibacteria bacterium]|jgi:hypothetical protein